MQPGMQCLLANVVWAQVTWTEKWVGQAPLYVQRQSSGSSVVRQPLVLGWNPIRCSIETKYFSIPGLFHLLTSPWWMYSVTERLLLSVKPLGRAGAERWEKVEIVTLTTSLPVSEVTPQICTWYFNGEPTLMSLWRDQKTLGIPEMGDNAYIWEGWVRNGR